MTVNPDELFPVVDPAGNVIGSATRSECHNGVSRPLHPVVHLHVCRDGMLYLQHRSPLKDIQPGRWDTSVGGHVDYGESVADALRRESREELELDIDGMEILAIPPYLFESPRERELINPHVVVISDGTEPSPDPDEISEGRFWSIPEIERAIGTGVLTPNFEQEFAIIKPFLK